jgi:hypothetical protein
LLSGWLLSLFNSKATVAAAVAEAAAVAVAEAAVVAVAA